MQLTIEQALQQAVVAHNGGNLNEAERIYRAILQSQPKNSRANHNLGVIAVSLNRIEAALPLFKIALDTNPNVEQFWLSYVDALIKAKRPKEAKQAIKKAKKRGFDTKKLGKRLSQSKAVTESNAQDYCNAGNTLLLRGSLNEAEASYNQAIALKPDYAEAYNNLGSTLTRLDRLNEAEASYNQAIALKPDFAEAYFNLGIALQGLGRVNEAESNYKQAIAVKPDYAEAHNNLGNTLEALGRLKEAETSYNKAIAFSPDYSEAHINLGNTLKLLGRLNEAESSYNEAIALQPSSADAHYNLGLILQGLGRVNEAESTYSQAIRLKPDFAEAYRQISMIKKLDSQDERFLKMLDLHSENVLPDEERCHINFGLAKVYEDLENFERAFTHYVEGNELRKTLLGYHISEDRELFESIKSNYPRLLQYHLDPNETPRSVTPIFIIGMPRSGTTLVEQIVSSHSLVTGAGELPYVNLLGSAIATGASDISHDALMNFRNVYLDHLKDYSEGNLWVIDKMPQNFRYLGLLSTAFPDAKFVHVNRRPEAICWGNFKTYFSGNGLGYAWATDDIVAYYKLYQGLMAFWENELCHKVYNLDYELLTSNQKRETRKLIDFIGLDWDDNCLRPEGNTRSVSTASNLQVRQRVYTGSSDQWRNYEPFLDGAFEGV